MCKGSFKFVPILFVCLIIVLSFFSLRGIAFGAGQMPGSSAEEWGLTPVGDGRIPGLPDGYGDGGYVCVSSGCNWSYDSCMGWVCYGCAHISCFTGTCINDTKHCYSPGCTGGGDDGAGDCGCPGCSGTCGCTQTYSKQCPYSCNPHDCNCDKDGNNCSTCWDTCHYTVTCETCPDNCSCQCRPKPTWEEVSKAVFDKLTPKYNTFEDHYPGCTSCGGSCDPWDLYCAEKQEECGDGDLEGDEQCEVGNPSGHKYPWGETCNASTQCKYHQPDPDCGDGKLEGEEQCEVGNPAGHKYEWGSTCNKETECQYRPTKTCGNGILEGDEECEVGNPTGYKYKWGNTCNKKTKCKGGSSDEYCGDGKLQEGEQCEKGVSIQQGATYEWGDECNEATSCRYGCPDCPPEPEEPYCGDGIIQDDEDCEVGDPAGHTEKWGEKCNVETECEKCVECGCEDLDCYTNPDNAYRSTVSFKAVDNNDVNEYNYVAKRWSGITSNNPVDVTATYYNLTNGNYRNIETLHFWMQENGTVTLENPMMGNIEKVSTKTTKNFPNGVIKLASNNSFGFMLRKKDNRDAAKAEDIMGGDWKNNYDVYLPGLEGGELRWIKLDTGLGTNKSFIIYGSTGKAMIKIDGIDIDRKTNLSNAKERIQLKFRMTFFNAKNVKQRNS